MGQGDSRPTYQNNYYEINKNDISDQSDVRSPNNPLKVHDNTLCGLSNINKESESEKFDDGFDKGGSGSRRSPY